MTTGNTNRPLASEISPLTLGRGSLVGANAVLYTGLTLGEDVMVSDLATIREGCLVADRVVVGRGVMIMYDTTLGENTRVIDGAILTGGMTVESDVFIGPGVCTINDNDVYLKRFRPRPLRGARADRPSIRSRGRWRQSGGRRRDRHRGNRRSQRDGDSRRPSVDGRRRSSCASRPRDRPRGSPHPRSSLRHFGRARRCKLVSLISVVVPVYHNATSLPELLERLRAVSLDNPAEDFEFIFVDDGSTDDSFDVLQELARSEPLLRIVKLSRNFGSNAALLAGLNQARGNAVAAIAADLQDPPELITEMLALWRNDRKVVLGGRRERSDPGLTSVMADIFYMMFRRFGVATMPKRGFDFFLIDRKVRDLVIDMKESNSYLMGTILWLGFEPAIVYYDRTGRAKHHGSSMWSLRKKVKYFIDAFVAFSYMPIRLSSCMGIVLSVLGILYAIVVVLTRLFYDFEAEGWASIMVVLLVVSGAQMLTLGILGEYLWRNLDETRRRPRYVIDEVIEPTEATESRDAQPDTRSSHSTEPENTP